MDEYMLPKTRPSKAINPGDEIRVGKRMATFIRVVTPKRDPWGARTHIIVQFKGNIGTSKVKISSLT